MDKINRLFETIKAIRKFNSYCKDIQPDTVRLAYHTLENLSKPIKKMEWMANTDPDLFFLEVTCCISSETAHKKAIQTFYTEVKAYIDWFNLNQERVCKLTDIHAICRSVEVILPYIKTGYDLTEAKEVMQKAETDRHIHHMLARAYGAINGHGAQYDELSTSDKEYIKEPLEEYKRHFKVSKVDLPKMYDDYHFKCCKEFNEVEKRLSEAYRLNNEDKLRLASNIKLDMHQHVASLLWPYMSYLQEAVNKASETQEMAETRNTPGRRPLGVFDSFEDMFNSHDHFMIIDNYIRTKGSLNSSESKSIFTAITRPEDTILKDRVSMEHFGTLIIKQYGLICSFTSGKSVADGKVFDDIESTIKALLGITETTQTK